MAPWRRYVSSLIGLLLDFADPSMNRDLARFADARAAMLAKGFDEIASGQGLSLLRRR